MYLGQVHTYIDECDGLLFAPCVFGFHKDTILCYPFELACVISLVFGSLFKDKRRYANNLYMLAVQSLM